MFLTSSPRKGGAASEKGCTVLRIEKLETFHELYSMHFVIKENKLKFGKPVTGKNNLG